MVSNVFCYETSQRNFLGESVSKVLEGCVVFDFWTSCTLFCRHRCKRRCYLSGNLSLHQHRNRSRNSDWRFLGIAAAIGTSIVHTNNPYPGWRVRREDASTQGRDIQLHHTLVQPPYHSPRLMKRPSITGLSYNEYRTGSVMRDVIGYAAQQ